MMTLSLAQPGTSGTVTVAATEDETQTAIAALLSLGLDIPPPNVELDKNAALVPLVPQAPEPGPTPQQTGATQTVPVVIGTAVKEEQKTVQPKSEPQSMSRKRKHLLLWNINLSRNMLTQNTSFLVKSVVKASQAKKRLIIILEATILQ